jgi:hypothetical protein
MIAGAVAAPAKGGQCKTVCAPEPAPPPPANGGVCKVICAAPVAQAKPKPAPMAKRAAAKPRAIRPVRRAAHHRPHRYAERRDYYSYRETAREEEHGAWHQAPNDAIIPGPQPYGPPPPPPPPSYGASGGYYAEGTVQDYQSYQGGYGYCDCAADQAGLQIDRYGWTGGVGYAGGSEVFVDGYGMVHYGSGRSLNGPTYNSYGQSFPFNPSRAAPFQPRVMGGVAVGGARMGGGFGPHR